MRMFTQLSFQKYVKSILIPFCAYIAFPILSLIFKADTVGMRSKTVIGCPICKKYSFSKETALIRKVNMPEFFKTRTRAGKYLYLFLSIPSKRVREFLRHQLDVLGLKSKYTFYVCDHCNSFVRDFFLESGALLPETVVYEHLYKRQKLKQRTFSRELKSDPRYNLTSDFIASWLPKCAGIGLDVGCAEGYLSVVMREKHNINLLGIDPSHSMITSAKEKHDFPENFRQGDYVRSLFEEESFDFIVCTHVIEHLMDPTTTINNFYYHLKKSVTGPGGLLFLSTPCSNLLSLEKVNQLFNDNFNPGHLWIASLEGLTEKVISAGFTLVYSEINPSGSLSGSGEKPQGMTLVFTTSANGRESNSKEK